PASSGYASDRVGSRFSKAAEVLICGDRPLKQPSLCKNTPRPVVPDCRYTSARSKIRICFIFKPFVALFGMSVASGMGCLRPRAKITRYPARRYGLVANDGQRPARTRAADEEIRRR